MHHRRQVLKAAALGLACPLFAHGQRVARIGVLSNWDLKTADGAVAPVWVAFYDELGKRGWNAGRNLVVETRLASGKPDGYATAAAELVATRPEVFLGTSSNAIDALRKVSSTVPIVMVTVGFAVEAGYVQSLARPGGNVTGVTSVTAGSRIQDKRMQLIQAMRPDLKKMAVLWDPRNSGSVFGFRAAQDTAARFGLQLISLPVEKPGDLEAALKLAVQHGVQALQIHPTTGADDAKLAAWAIDNRIATMGQPNTVPIGYLMAYGPDIPDQFRIAATHVDRILRGSRAAELPVELPTLYRFSLNLKTAKALRLNVPQELLLRADEVVR